jgi:hypothetical protein
MGTSQPPSPNDKDDTVAVARSFLSATELLSDHELARVYTDILLNQPTTNSNIASRLGLPESTTSERVTRLIELDIVRDTSDGKANQLVTDPIEFTVSLNTGTVVVTPTIIAAYGARDQVDEIELFLDRHDRAKLVAAVEYTIAYLDGELSRRSIGVEMDLSSVEAIAITQAVEPIVALLHAVDTTLPELEHDVHTRKITAAPYVVER